MPAFLAVVEFLVAISLIVTLVSNYLIVNKLWKRRATKEVAESISIAAALLGLSTAFPFLFTFLFIDHSPAGAAKTGIGIATGFVFVAIGSGIFVPELRRQGFLRLFARALNLERRESGHLIRAMVQPRGADRMLRVLARLAAVDGRVDEREIALIREFAREWKLEPPTLRSGSTERDMLALRESLVEYLELGPPKDQARQFLDLLHILARADTHVSAEEELVLDELSGLVHHYLEAVGSDGTLYEVLIVPQSEAQVEAVRELLPGREEKLLRGGRVFSAGRYFSARYADVVCHRYIDLGLFTVILADDPRHALPSAPATTSRSTAASGGGT